MRRNILFLSAVVVFFGVIWFFFGRSTLASGQVVIGQIVYRVEIATDPASQYRGLRGRTAVPDGTGMYFIFTGSPSSKTFTMDGVLIPLDLLWIRERRIIGISAELPPASRTKGSRYDSPGAIDAVLELASGTVAKSSITIGDSVHFLPR